MIIKEYLHPCNITYSEYWVLNSCQYHKLNKNLIITYTTILIFFIIVINILERR